MYETKPELIGIYNNGVKGGGGGGGGTGPTITITIPSATLSSEGVVVTGNTNNPSLTEQDVTHVPTQWFFQNEIARLEQRINDLAGAVRYTPINTSIVDAENSTQSVSLDEVFAFSPGGLRVTPLNTITT